MSAKKIKTNASRILDELGVAYTLLTYAVDEDDLSGVHAAEALGLDPACVFKTLVARGDRTAAARSVGEKSVAMIHVADINKVTGYVRGGCSPVGMKKRFPTFIDDSAEPLPRIAVSAGARGVQFFLKPADLAGAVSSIFAPLILK